MKKLFWKCAYKLGLIKIRTKSDIILKFVRTTSGKVIEHKVIMSNPEDFKGLPYEIIK